jgi:hypothetical protein
MVWRRSRLYSEETVRNAHILIDPYAAQFLREGPVMKIALEPYMFIPLRDQDGGTGPSATRSE